MTKDYRQFMLASAVLLTMSAPNVFAADATSTAVNDARQEAQIWTTYALSPYLRANDIKVVVHDGSATLTGKVDEDVNKELAKEIASKLPAELTEMWENRHWHWQRLCYECC